MKTYRNLATSIILLWLSACGTVVPNIQEHPYDRADGLLLIKSIVNSVHCEVRNALIAVIKNDNDNAALNKRSNAVWLHDWGVQLQLTLTIDESTTVGTSITGTPPGAAGIMASLAGGATGSATATRVEKLSFFYSVRQLVNMKRCTAGINDSPSPSPLIQSDLKLREWLSAQVLLQGIDLIQYPTSSNNVFQQDVLSHQITFVVDTSANFNPLITLTRATINDAGNLFSINRKRSHDLLITMGPLDPSQPLALARPAADVALAAQIATAIGGTRFR